MNSASKLDWPFQLRQLAVMVAAGISIDASLASLASQPNINASKLQKALRLVKRGFSLPDAFRRAALITDFDYEMLRCANEAGRLADGLNHISERRVSQLQRSESLKASLILPKALVAMGVFGGFFVRTASGSQSITEMIVSIGTVVVWFYLVVYIAMVVIRADPRIWMSWLWPYSWLHRNSEWYRLALEYLFYKSLLWQVSAGVSASIATKNCHKLLSSVHFQSCVVAASESMSRGESMPSALINGGLVLTSRMRQVLLIADQSGKHETAIKHELAIQEATLKQKSDDLFRWLPRVFYVIALVAVSKLIAV